MNSLNQSSGSSVTNKLLAMKFFGEFILIYPLIPIMYQHYGHVSAAGIGLILGLGLALSVILEIPTGIVADKVPRKYVLIVSILLKIGALFIWLTLHDFRGYLLAATVFALGYAFESGTLQAYLYGALGDEDKKGFGKFWARVSAMVMVSYSIAYVLTTIVGINYPLLISLSIVPCVVALIICISLPTDTLYASTKKSKPRVFASALAHIKKSPDLIKLIIGGVVIVALANVMTEFLSLYYNQVGVTIRFVPIMMAIGNLLGAAGFWSLHKWDSTLTRLRLFLLVLASLIFVVLFMGGVIAAVVGVMLFTRYVRLLQVQYESTIQHLSNDEARATISSIGSFGSSLIGALIMASIGLSATNNSVVRPIRVSLLIGAFAYLVIQLISRRQKTNSRSSGQTDSYVGLTNEKISNSN
jgi:MFS family permease